MRELILGGEGLIGTELVTTLRQKGHQVVSLDLKTGCDLRFVDDRPFEECDRVWFLAWDTGGAKYHLATDKQHQMYKHNCELSVRVFDALARTRRPFLFVTSQLAGQPTAYGMTKLIAEKWATQLGGRIARLWNTYGWEKPDIRSHVVTDLVISGLRKRSVKTHTDGCERRRFIYKSDCVAALIQLFDGAETSAEIAGKKWITIRELAEEIARQLRVTVELGRAQGEEVMMDPSQVLLGFRPKISLEEGVALVIRDAKNWLDRDVSYVERTTG